MRFRQLALIPAAGLLAGTAIAGLAPRPAQAEKLPVDCSGRKTSCYEQRSCSQWINHVCYEYTSYFWQWYY